MKKGSKSGSQETLENGFSRGIGELFLHKNLWDSTAFTHNYEIEYVRGVQGFFGKMCTCVQISALYEKVISCGRM
jgi:hypothetical protein